MENRGQNGGFGKQIERRAEADGRHRRVERTTLGAPLRDGPMLAAPPVYHGVSGGRRRGGRCVAPTHYGIGESLPTDDGRPPFDEKRAASFVGKYVLVGLTYYDHKVNILEQRQVHGDIISADSRHGFAIKLRGQRSGETFWLPPDLQAFEPAQPGEYRLRSSGEVVLDPDLFCNWTVNKPQPKRAWWKFW